MRDRATSKPRGFGFVTFSEPGAAEAACAAQHTLDGRQIDAKPSVPPGEHSRPRSKKIFVGGLSPETTEGEPFFLVDAPTKKKTDTPTIVIAHPPPQILYHQSTPPNKRTKQSNSARTSRPSARSSRRRSCSTTSPGAPEGLAS